MFYVFQTAGSEGNSYHVVEATPEEIASFKSILSRVDTVIWDWGGELPFFDETTYSTKDEALRSIYSNDILNAIDKIGISASEYRKIDDYVNNHCEIYDKMKMPLHSFIQNAIYNFKTYEAKELCQAIINEIKNEENS